MHRRHVSILLASSGLVALTACDRPSDNSTPPAAAPRTADNTGRNRADRDTNAKTPLDQSNSAEDTRITADIRKSVMEDSSLSMNAHNCKIITDHGAVTLRGPVDSQSEKDTVEAKAKAVAGVASVSNELEVKTK